VEGEGSSGRDSDTKLVPKIFMLSEFVATSSEKRLYYVVNHLERDITIISIELHRSGSFDRLIKHRK